MKKNKKNISRREALKKTAIAAAGSIVIPTIVPSTVFGKSAPSNKINIGQIGFGRIAATHDVPGTLKHDISRIVAVADVDLNRAHNG